MKKFPIYVLLFLSLAICYATAKDLSVSERKIVDEIFKLKQMVVLCSDPNAEELVKLNEILGKLVASSWEYDQKIVAPKPKNCSKSMRELHQMRIMQRDWKPSEGLQ